MTHALACRILAFETALDQLELRALRDLANDGATVVASDAALELVQQGRALVGIARAVHTATTLPPTEAPARA